jgi:hypothetical protein
LECWIRIRIKVKIPKLWRLKIELWRAVDAHMGGVSVNHFTWKQEQAVMWIRILFCSVLDPNPDRSDLKVWDLLDPVLLVSCGSGSDIGQVMVSVPVSVPDPDNILHNFPTTNNMN